MTAIDDAETVLNLRYGTGWDLYRLMGGGWNVKLPDDSIHGDTLESALAAAVAFVPLPKIPRRRVRSAGLDLEHSGRWWYLSARPARQRVGAGYMTKKQAEEARIRLLAAAETAADEWESKYLATVTNGTEGVDWRWER